MEHDKPILTSFLSDVPDTKCLEQTKTRSLPSVSASVRPSIFNHKERLFWLNFFVTSQIGPTFTLGIQKYLSFPSVGESDVQYGLR